MTPLGDAPVAIAFYNRFFEQWPDLPDGCDVPVRFTTGPEAAVGADAVVFHIPTLPTSDPLPPKGTDQLWVAWSMESPIMCPRLSDPSFMGRFDLTMTYERTSDVWCTYFGQDTVTGLARPRREPVASAPVVYLQANANDRCGRLGYAAELMRRVRVDSFGTVLRNRPEVIPPGSAARVALYRRYKFTLAFENSFAPDYVTEKLFEPLVAGAVPVYRGCPEVADLAPSPDCYVDVGRFASATELGAYLDHLDRDDDEYAGYQAWRGRDLSPSFLAAVEAGREPAFCRLARAVSERSRVTRRAMG